jgi:hypothetical protein
MNSRTMMSFMLWSAAAGGLAHPSHGQVLDLTLSDPDQSVAAGTTSVVFDAILSNPTGSTIYLNGATITTSSSALNGDATPFLINAPLDLAPGASTGPLAFFDVDLAKGTPAATFGTGSFQIQGGADGGAGTAFDQLAAESFSVTVTGSTAHGVPEIDTSATAAALTLFLGALILLRSGWTPRRDHSGSSTLASPSPRR